MPVWLFAFTSVLLLALVATQFVWVHKSANEQEKQFNDKVKIALNIIVDKIAKDRKVCESVGSCLKKDKKKFCKIHLNHKKEWVRIDSIIKTELKHYDIDLNYEFDICERFPDGKPFKKNVHSTYTQSMDEILKKTGVILYLDFPDKSRFLRNEMGHIFISSILLIVFLTISFVLTYRFYRKEKRLTLRTRDFINNMTHEFKTPLANISFANNMISGLEISDKKDKLKTYTGIIDTENKRLVHNCDLLLQIAQADNDIHDAFEVFDLNKVVQEATTIFNHERNNKTAEIILALREGALNVSGNKTFFYNVMVNLIDNAIKYADENRAIQITISTELKGKEIEIKVADNGIGIAKEHLSLIFEKFYRISDGDTHNTKGFGLGLSFVRTIINKMNGNITVESQLGIGSVFIIKLPFVP